MKLIGDHSVLHAALESSRAQNAIVADPLAMQSIDNCRVYQLNLSVI
jgi:hypothetical protein